MMQAQEQTESKKVWTAPELVVYGPIEELTGDQGKAFGLSDGFFLLDPSNTLTNMS